MAIDDVVRTLRQQRTADGGPPVPDTFQGVSKERVRSVLRRLDRETDDMVDVVFALLDNQTPSFYRAVRATHRVSDGASTAHICCLVGILQRGGNRLDREGRDYWIKPLREPGAIEPVYLHPASNGFIDGWPVPKSGNCASRLSSDFVDILTAAEDEWQELLDIWTSEDNQRQRLRLQAAAAEASRRLVDTKHGDLITRCVKVYAPHFLPGFVVLYTDQTDGDRVTDAERQRLSDAGVHLQLGDAMPDVLLLHPGEARLWVVEAVTSDGEVDRHKVEQLSMLASRSGFVEIGFTTAYWSWKDAASRQGRHKNIAADTWVWIAEDPGKHFLAQAFTSK